MSLFKQLWLAIIALLFLVFGCSFVVSSLSAKRYLEQQLFMKNTDNAAALALSLTQQEADPVLMELTLAAQFDTGHYEMIELIDPEGKVIIRRSDSQDIDEAPAWFVKLLPIEVADGVAQVQQGWQQSGTLRLRSHSRFAYGELWSSTQLLALVFLLAMVVSGLLGHWMLRRILRPLDAVVDQATALGERRFITIEEPRTLEFRQLVQAMNNLSERMKKILREEARRLEKWQSQSQVDKVTGLNNRESFMQNLEACLGSDDVNASGTLALIRLTGLAQLNQVYGRKTIDSLLKDIGNALRALINSQSRWAASRLNGSDFAILAPNNIEADRVAREAQQVIRGVLSSHSMSDELTLPAASTVYLSGESAGEILTRLDGSLLAADREGHSAVSIAHQGDVQMLPMREQMNQWHKLFQSAFRDDRFYLAVFPVVDMEDRLIHLECPVRLRSDDGKLAAGTFMPWINRLEMSRELDQRVIDLALGLIEEHQRPICVNLSASAVTGPSFNLWLCDRLSSNSRAAEQLWIEIAEPAAFRHLEDFRRLCERLKSYQTRIGIEHVGHQVADIGQLHDLGLDYLKVDSYFVRGVDSNIANQTLLRTLCTVGHALGVKMIAEGVQTQAEKEMLGELGIDGVTGPAVSPGKG